MERGEYITLLQDDFQEVFWSTVNPRIDKILSFAQAKETWTVPYSTATEQYEKVSLILPKLSGVLPNNKKILDELSLLLSYLPLRQSLCLVSWIDQNIDSGLSQALYSHCFFEQDNLSAYTYSESRLFIERLSFVLKTKLSISLFSNIKL